MIESVSIVNFKSIRSLELQLSPLNVLIGPNSSGKTSVLQALAMLKQSLDALKFNGPWTMLGNFRDVVYNHSDSTPIRISFRVRPSADLSHDYLTDGLLDCNLTIEGDRQRQPIISRSSVAINKRKVFSYERGRRVLDTERNAWIGEVDSEFGGISFQTGGIVPISSSGSVDQLEKYRREIYDPIADELTRFLYYVSARRGICVRYDDVDTSYRAKPADVGLYGEKTIPVLAYIQHDAEYDECMKKIGFWQKRFGLTESVAALVEGKEKPGYSLRVKNEKTGIQSNIIDVGFGVNQLLSFIVQSFYAPKGSLIMVEQPEAHLHPRYQAEVADLLIDIVNYGNRIIVETHSEHLLLRLQRRIAEKEMPSRNVNVNYFELGKEGTSRLILKMDDNGYFEKPIPEGFFEEGFKEALAHIRAANNKGDKIESNG